MLYVAAPILVSYVLFVFIAEHINPFRKFRENGKRRRINEGRKIALMALPIGYGVVGTLHLLTYSAA